MNESGKAVFLSYASQDAEATHVICEALRSAGVEVWFDQSELLGGDSWDEKIRKQIRECALFVPVISAATQARLEGYFRIEWKLAAQRTHAMAEAKAFLLPVVIDGTRDAEAHVPAEFRAVQWTRLPFRPAESPEHGRGTQGLRPGDVALAGFCARVTNLVGGASGTRAASLAQGNEAPSSPGAGSPALPRKSTRRWLVPALVGLTAVCALAIWQPWKAAPVAAPLTPSNAPVSEARQLTLRARGLIDDDLMAVRENFRLAEELCQRAVGLDATDGEAWATWARVSLEMIRRAYDTTPQRRDSARSQAERAIRLRPDSIEAGLAMAALSVTGDTGESERRLRDLIGRAPLDARVALALAEALQTLGQDAAASEIRLTHPAFAGKDPRPLIAETQDLRRKGRLIEALAMIERAQALAPTPLGYRVKFVILGLELGDLEAARLYLETVPPQLLLEDALASRVAQVWIRLGQGDKAIGVLRRIPRDFLEEYQQVLPKGYLTGWGQQISGRATAAEAEWKQALVVVDKRLVAEPNQPAMLRWKALLLALTGQKEEADKAHKLYSELSGQSTNVSDDATFLLAQGRPEEAIRALQAARTAAGNGARLVQSYSLRDAPWFEPVRKDPRVQQIIADGEAWVKDARSIATVPAAK